MAVGKGAHELGGDLGAFDRRHGYSERVLQHTHVETGEMHQLGHVGVGHQLLQIGTVISPPPQANGHDLHQMCHAIAGGELYEAETIAMGVETHGLGVNGDDRPKVNIRGQVIAVKVDRPGRVELYSHATSVLPLMVPRRRLELPQPCGHRYLKPARLPIPPPGHGNQRRRASKPQPRKASIGRRSSVVGTASDDR